MAKSNLGFLFSIAEWISRFAYLNILWIAFSIVGIVIFGFFPSTVSMFVIVRKWLQGESEFPIFKTFWTSYKKEFMKSNLLGLVLALVVAIVYADLRFMDANIADLSLIIEVPLYLFIFGFVLTSLYLLPVYVHYDVKFLQMFKNAFFIMIINPIYNLIMLIGLVVTGYAISLVPGAAFFFGGSVMTYIILWPCLRAFEKIEQKKHPAAPEEN